MIPLRDNIRSRTFPLVTWSLIALNALVFLVETRLGPDRLEQFVRRFGLIPAVLTEPSLWRELAWFNLGPLALLTSVFVHGGWWHLLGNVWTLYIFGDNVEDRMGHARFALFYIVCGILAGLVHALVFPASPVSTIGASGAISGILGAYFLLYPTASIIVLFPVFFIPLFFEVPALIYLAVWIVLQLQGGLLSLAPGLENTEGVAFWAHVGGFLGGMALVFAFLPSRRSHGPRRDLGKPSGWSGQRV